MTITPNSTPHQPVRSATKVPFFCNSAVNYHRTAVKMQLMCDQIKSMRNNEQMMNSFGQLSAAVSNQMGQVDTMNMAQNLQTFN